VVGLKEWLDQLLGRDAAWQEGYETASAEAQEMVDSMDAFIEEQADIIHQLMEDNLVLWQHVPKELMDKLRNYV
jgi:hypothetical protein